MLKSFWLQLRLFEIPKYNYITVFDIPSIYSKYFRKSENTYKTPINCEG